MTSSSPPSSIPSADHSAFSPQPNTSHPIPTPPEPSSSYHKETTSPHRQSFELELQHQNEPMLAASVLNRDVSKNSSQALPTPLSTGSGTPLSPSSSSKSSPRMLGHSSQTVSKVGQNEQKASDDGPSSRSDNIESTNEESASKATMRPRRSSRINSRNSSPVRNTVSGSSPKLPSSKLQKSSAPATPISSLPTTAAPPSAIDTMIPSPSNPIPSNSSVLPSSLSVSIVAPHTNSSATQKTSISGTIPKLRLKRILNPSVEPITHEHHLPLPISAPERPQGGEVKVSTDVAPSVSANGSTPVFVPPAVSSIATKSRKRPGTPSLSNPSGDSADDFAHRNTESDSKRPKLADSSSPKQVAPNPVSDDSTSGRRKSSRLSRTSNEIETSQQPRAAAPILSKVTSSGKSKKSSKPSSVSAPAPTSSKAMIPVITLRIPRTESTSSIASAAAKPADHPPTPVSAVPNLELEKSSSKGFVITLKTSAGVQAKKTVASPPTSMQAPRTAAPPTLTAEAPPESTFISPKKRGRPPSANKKKALGVDQSPATVSKDVEMRPKVQDKSARSVKVIAKKVGIVPSNTSVEVPGSSDAGEGGDNSSAMINYAVASTAPATDTITKDALPPKSTTLSSLSPAMATKDPVPPVSPSKAPPSTVAAKPAVVTEKPTDAPAKIVQTSQTLLALGLSAILGEPLDRNPQLKSKLYCGACKGKGVLIGCAKCTLFFHYSCLEEGFRLSPLSEGHWTCRKCTLKEMIVSPTSSSSAQEMSPLHHPTETLPTKTRSAFTTLVNNLNHTNPKKFVLPTSIIDAVLSPSGENSDTALFESPKKQAKLARNEDDSDDAPFGVLFGLNRLQQQRRGKAESSTASEDEVEKKRKVGRPPKQVVPVVPAKRGRPPKNAAPTIDTTVAEPKSRHMVIQKVKESSYVGPNDIHTGLRGEPLCYHCQQIGLGVSGQPTASQRRRSTLVNPSSSSQESVHVCHSNPQAGEEMEEMNMVRCDFCVRWWHLGCLSGSVYQQNSEEMPTEERSVSGTHSVVLLKRRGQLYWKGQPTTGVWMASERLWKCPAHSLEFGRVQKRETAEGAAGGWEWVEGPGGRKDDASVAEVGKELEEPVDALTVDQSGKEMSVPEPVVVKNRVHITEQQVHTGFAKRLKLVRETRSKDAESDFAVENSTNPSPVTSLLMAASMAKCGGEHLPVGEQRWLWTTAHFTKDIATHLEVPLYGPDSFGFRRAFAESEALKHQQ
ncbi:hypothetical protein HDV05_002110 [Chytridiales sp. JEL 0842]|nr:hypothetical protein HDV05_002110 [Chytridiales sp. JEL 0842]